jgi:prepilin-type N-terminal cleavage/methylation domain-containing protein
MTCSFIQPVQKTRIQPTQKTRGMTLIEILVALVILGITIMLFGSFVTSLQSDKKATEQTTALAYARNYLEGLRSKWQTLEGYQKLSLATPDNPPPNYELEVTIQNDAGDTIFSFPSGSSSSDLSPLRNITLTFTDEEDKTVTLGTQLARPTPAPMLEEDDE